MQGLTNSALSHRPIHIRISTVLSRKELTILLLPPQLIIDTENYPSPPQIFFDWKHLPSPTKIGGHYFAAVGVLRVDYLGSLLLRKCMQTFAFPLPQGSTKTGYSTLHWILEQFLKKSLKETASNFVKPQTGIKSESGPRVPPVPQPKLRIHGAQAPGMTGAQKKGNSVLM